MTSGRRTRPRRGGLLIETAAAGLMLSLAMLAITRVVAAVAAERRIWHRREVATAAAADAMERLAARPFGSLPIGPVDGLELDGARARSLPGGEIVAEVAPDGRDGVLDAKRISLRIRWRNPAGGWDAPVRLTSWIHRREGGR